MFSNNQQILIIISNFTKFKNYINIQLLLSYSKQIIYPMPQDFFAQGFGQEQGPVFSKQQNQFLEKKIVFLDPMKTYQISIGKVLALLKYTNLDNETIKKILNNSCANGIGQKIITYEEMKKIFRGVALKQNKIEPSKINIQANIKTKMPIFYDDDDSEEEQQPKPQPTQQRPSQPIKAPPQSHVAPVNQPPQPPKPVQQPPQVNPLKAFDDYWKTLKTKNNLIDGTQVKKMFSNNAANKNNLSKAWKLCNISEKGVLTKGEFFIFMNLIHGGNIPQALTKEMKDLIKQIEEACGYKKAQTQPTSQRSSSMSNPSNPAPKSKAGSDAFDKFGDESLFVKNNSKVEELSKSVTIHKSSQNVFSTPGPSTLASSSILSPPPTAQNIPQPSSKAALQLLQRVETVSKQQKTHHQQLTNLATNNEQLTTGLSAIQQYLSIVEDNFAITSKKIETLKQTQSSLNERLNNVCVKFKNIITKQSECITFLMDSMKFESEASQQRLQILESYTEQMLGMVEGNLEVTRQQVGNIQKQNTQAYEGVRYQNEQLKQKLSGGKVHHSPTQLPKITTQNPSHRGTPEISHYTKTDPFDDNEAQQPHHQEHQQQAPSSKSIQRGSQQPTNHFSNQPHSNPPQQTGHIFLDNLSPEERKKTKQMLLIQILNSVSSMTQEEYKEVVGKVVAMTEEQMNQSYTKLYALYMQNIAKTGVAPKYPVPSPQEFTVSHS